MAICGFNKKIGDGLRLLVEGMVEALEKKAAISSPEDVLAKELVELDSMISVLTTAEGQVLPEMFVGLNLLAKALFTQVQSELESSKNGSLGSACLRIGDRFIDLLARTEIQSEEIRSERNASGSVGEKARNLAQWALDRSYEAPSCSVSTGA